jgi:hypothetical protein
MSASRKTTRALTASEIAALERWPTDIALPDHPDAKQDAIDRLARIGTPKRSANAPCPSR